MNEPVTESTLRQSQPAAKRRSPARYFAIASFPLSLSSFSIGIFDFSWLLGLVLAAAALISAVIGLTRPGARGWAIAGLLVSLLFITLTWILSTLLGLPFSTFLRI